MKVRPLIPGLCALVLCFGCEDDTTTSDTSRPSLRVGGGGECGATLPVPTQAEFAMRTYRTAAVTVSGTDPGASSMEIRNGTEVTLVQSSSNPDTPQVVAFVSGFDAALAGGVAGPVALQQAAESDAVTFVGGGAVDRVFCISGGTAIIEASIPSYAGGGGFVGPVTTPQNQRFQIRCVSPEVYEQQCGNPVPPDAAPPSEDAGSDAGATDGGVDAEVGDGGPRGPALWNIQFVPPEDLSDLVIGIRNSGLGRRDNTELTFQVAELDTPLRGILVKFFLDEITQPGVTISGGNASLFDADNEVVVATGADGLARVRLVAGGTPGLAAVRAVALRYDTDDLRGCMEGAENFYECLFEAYCGRNLSRVDQSPECEQDRSQAVTIEAGIPSGRSLHFGCVNPVVSAFTQRERVRGQDHWDVAGVDGTECTVQLVDRVNGRIKSGTSVFFLSEAGSVTATALTNEDGRASTLHRIGQDPPKDVPADEYELEAGFPENGHNPRDGQVRIVVFTRGEEAFEDVDGDSVFNEAAGDFQEPGQDLPEPFVDFNDNGTYDFGERFRDSNNNGVWDDSNGQWDASTDIWDSTTVLWVGELFSCVAGGATSSPDCLDPDLIPRNLHRAVVEVTCGEGCSRNAPFNPLCVAGAVFLDPGQAGQFSVSLGFLDINGNCVNGGGVAAYTVNPGADLAPVQGNQAQVDPLNGSLFCLVGFEKPLGQVLSFTLVDTFVPDPEAALVPTVTPVEISFTYKNALAEDRQISVTIPVCR